MKVSLRRLTIKKGANGESASKNPTYVGTNNSPATGKKTLFPGSRLQDENDSNKRVTNIGTCDFNLNNPLLIDYLSTSRGQVAFLDLLKQCKLLVIFIIGKL